MSVHRLEGQPEQAADIRSREARVSPADAPLKDQPAAKNQTAAKKLPKTWYTEWQPRTYSFVPLTSDYRAGEPRDTDESPWFSILRPLQPVLAALALLAVAAMLIWFALPRRTTPKTQANTLSASSNPAAASSDPSAPATASLPPLPAPSARVPLAVTLFSTGEGRHVRVGTPVTVAAYTTLPRGQSATLAVSFRKNHGYKTLLSLAQGSLSSAIWTPLTPGRYVFQANVQDDRRHSALSHPISIWADAAPASQLSVRPQVAVNAVPATPAPAAMRQTARFAPPRPQIARLAPRPLARNPVKPAPRLAARPPVRLAVKPPVRLAVKRPVRLARPVVRVGAYRSIHLARRVQPHVQPHVQANQPEPRAAVLPPVHVVAAAFMYQRNAVLLADALRARGFHAVARRGVNGAGQPAYVVQTGLYLSAAKAQTQVQMLQKDGYPAYTVKEHSP